MYFLKDIINMLSEKKVSKKSPSKMNISSVLEQIGLMSRGKVRICSRRNDGRDTGTTLDMQGYV